jgi:hypothetical protein
VQWDLGDLVNPVPGEVTFRADVTYADGRHECGFFESEIGVRTDDVILIGWIDPANVPLSTVGVAPGLLTNFPPAGPPVRIAPLCDACQVALLVAQGHVDPCNFPMQVIPGDPSAATKDANRTYLLNWMFKYGGNVDPSTRIPGGDFRDSTDSYIASQEISTYVNGSTDYKLFNRFQVRYTVSTNGYLISPVHILQTERWIGNTTNPLAGCPMTLNPAPGQIGPNNSKVDTTNQSTWQVNEGSPDAQAILAFNTLMGNNDVPADPHYWESIGSRIRFISSAITPLISVQVYPTYYEYRNGRFVNVYPQASSPSGAFTLYPYPFGAVECPDSGHLQGRCGNATSPEHYTARVPPFLP